MNKTSASKKDKLHYKILNDRESVGIIAAKNVAQQIKKILRLQDEVRMIFAAAPSQNEFLDQLLKIEGINWRKITAFHMDEYIGLNKNADQLFSKYLNDRIFNKVQFKEVHLIQPDDPEKECSRYENLLKAKPIDIICMGIGENGHLAFNDPPVANFNDSVWVKIVELDEVCRQQQVNDGCFVLIDEVPTRAITLTIPALMSGNHLSVVVPGKNKSNAVERTLNGNISEECPSTILRNHNNAILYLDKDSSSNIEVN